ncbi:MAG: type II toxin-antitoxin system RelE family toxin [Acidimicrobiales bacterium]
MNSRSHRYRVELAPAARRQLRKLDRQVVRRALIELERLQADPRPVGCRAMVGQNNRWRIRVDGAGDYRIVYEVHDDQLLVLVVTVAHRREVYR